MNSQVKVDEYNIKINEIYDALKFLDVTSEYRKYDSFKYNVLSYTVGDYRVHIIPSHGLKPLVRVFKLSAILESEIICGRLKTIADKIPNEIFKDLIFVMDLLI